MAVATVMCGVLTADGAQARSGRVSLSLPKGGSSGYKGHPAAMEGMLQLALPRAPQLLSSMQGVLTVGHTCGMVANATCLAAAAVGSIPPSSDLHLQDAVKSAGWTHMNGVETRKMPADMIMAGDDESCAQSLYVGMWQASQASTTTALASGPWLRMHAAHSSSPARSSGPLIGQSFSSVEYQSSQSAATQDSLAALCSRLLEVVQCAPQLGVGQMQLRTLGGTHTGQSPAAYPAHTVSEAATQGILRTAASECPLMAVVTADSGCDVPSQSHRASHTVLTRVQRLLPSNTHVVPGQCQSSRDSGLYVLSGGLGALGLMMAEWMASSESAPLWLLGRSGRVSAQDAALRRLWLSSACVSAKRCDSSSCEEAGSLVHGEEVLRGFVHAGGVLQDATVANMTHAQCRGVFAPKMSGLAHMQTAMGAAPMNAVVLFSSISSFFGGVGQANYTAANAALDGAAMMRQACGLVGSSAQWGTWSGGGMALRDASTVVRAERGGLGW